MTLYTRSAKYALEMAFAILANYQVMLKTQSVNK